MSHNDRSVSIGAKWVTALLWLPQNTEHIVAALDDGTVELVSLSELSKGKVALILKADESIWSMCFQQTSWGMLMCGWDGQVRS